MRNLGIILICLSALGFVLAVITKFTGSIAHISPGGFSCTCVDLAIIAIALHLYFKKG
jgi:hypothetical protein